MSEQTQLKKLMESIDAATGDNYAIIPNADGHDIDNLQFDGTTPLYIMRDSDINGMVISANPITPDLMSDIINNHSNWK